MSSTLTDLTAATTWSGTDLFYATVGGNSRKIAAAKFLVAETSSSLAMQDSTTAQTFRIYRTFTDTSNYERMALQSGAGYVEVAAQTAGTGTDNVNVRITPANAGIVEMISNSGGFGNTLEVTNQVDSTFTNIFRCLASNITTGHRAQFTLGKSDTTGDMANFAFKYVGANDSTNAFEIAFNGDTVVKFSVLRGGGVQVAPGSTMVSGGETSTRLGFTNTSGFGIYCGSGAPSISAAQGSLYLRSDGSSTSTRLYVNTTGSTTWTNVTTAA